MRTFIRDFHQLVPVLVVKDAINLRIENSLIELYLKKVLDMEMVEFIWILYIHSYWSCYTLIHRGTYVRLFQHAYCLCYFCCYQSDLKKSSAFLILLPCKIKCPYDQGCKMKISHFDINHSSCKTNIGNEDSQNASF